MQSKKEEDSIMSTLTAGVDVGAATTKAVIIADDNLLSYFIMPTGAIVERSGDDRYRKGSE